MGSERYPRGSGIRHRTACLLAVVGFLVLFFAVLPGAASGGDGVAAADPGGNAHGLEGLSSAAPVPAVTLPATPAPARQNRTNLVRTVKDITERPKITVPAGLFLVVVAIAVIGMAAILFLLLRRRGDRIYGDKKTGAAPPGNPTVVGATAPPVFTNHGGRSAGGSPGGSTGPADLFPPSLGKRFSHAEFIGEGGLARVFRARNTRTGMTVAVKIPIRFDEETGTHFTRDITLWQGLGHENIIRILSSNILPVPYIEMEYAPSSLSAIPLPVAEERAIAIFLGVARGIAYAHERGIVHRDIKPENILLSAEGIPKITDWGLGRAVGDSRRSSVIGFSPAYAAPEQIAPHLFGRPGPSTDIYQLGMLLCELLTGAPAFRRNGQSQHDLYTAILDATPVILPWEGKHAGELTGIILRCLARRPEGRYATVADLIRDMERIHGCGS